MGEVLQKELRDRQPKISVAHDQARLEVGGQNIGAKTTGDVSLEDGKSDEIRPPGGDAPHQTPVIGWQKRETSFL